MVEKRSLDRMVNCMREKGITDVQMYTRLGISKQRFYGWKSRGSIPKEYQLPICKELNIHLEWLITGQGTKEAASVQSNTPDSFETSPEERALILKYRQLQDSQRTATQTMLDAMGQSKEMKKAG